MLYFIALVLFLRADMRPKVVLELSKYELLRQRLVTDYPEIDEETVADTLEGITDIHEMIAVVIRAALVDEALHAGLRVRIEDMRERVTRFELRAEKKRHLALEAMSAIGLTKLEQPDFTASTRTGPPALVVVSEDKIPSDYWIPQPPRLDRQKALTCLKRGTDIPGVHLANPKPVLMLRTK